MVAKTPPMGWNSWDCYGVSVTEDIVSANADGWTKFTEDEQRTMLTLWNIMRSPLMIGGDMVKNDDFTLKLLTNPDVLEMNDQSRFAHPLFRKEIDGNEIILWRAVRRDGGNYLAIINAGESEADLTLSLKECELETPVVSTRELWTLEQNDNVSEVRAKIPSHGVRAYFVD